MASIFINVSKLTTTRMSADALHRHFEHHVKIDYQSRYNAMKHLYILTLTWAFPILFFHLPDYRAYGGYNA